MTIMFYLLENGYRDFDKVIKIAKNLQNVNCFVTNQIKKEDTPI